MAEFVLDPDSGDAKALARAARRLMTARMEAARGDAPLYIAELTRVIREIGWHPGRMAYFATALVSMAGSFANEWAKLAGRPLDEVVAHALTHWEANDTTFGPIS